MRACVLYCLRNESSFRIPGTMSDRLRGDCEAEEEPPPQEEGDIPSGDPASE